MADRKAHPKTGEYVVHNIKSLYDEHRMKVLLGEETLLSEDDFIVREIATQYKETPQNLGRLFRNAVAAGRPYHVRSLLLTSSVPINEVPSSGQTALDRANSLRGLTREQKQIKDMIIDLLREKGAISGRHLNLTVTATPTDEGQEHLKKAEVQHSVS